MCDGFYDPVRDRIEGAFEWRNEEPTPPADEELAPEQGAEVLGTTNGEQNETSAVKENGAMDVDKENEGELPEFSTEDKIPDEEFVIDKGISEDKVIKTSTEGVRNSETAPPTENTSVDSAAAVVENSSDITSTETNANEPEEQTSIGAEIIEDPLSISGASVPNTGGEDESSQLENTVKADVRQESGIKDEEEEKKEPDGRFYLTRTPPHALRFRSLLDGPGPAPCWSAWPIWRKRWAFAAEAIRHETRLRMWSKKAIEEVLVERRSWLYHSIKQHLRDQSITPRWWRFDWLTEKEWEAFDEMTTRVRPETLRMWEETVQFMARRETYIVGRLSCDLCTNYIAFCRYLCIVCLSEDDSIDLCQHCFDKPEGILRGRSGTFAHLPSHSLLRSRKRVLSYEMNGLIIAARLTSDECKKMFRELEDAKKDKITGRTRKIGQGMRSRKAQAEHSLLEHVPPAEKPPIICACCKKIVSLPCWVCLECTPLAFICMSCDRKNGRINRAEHSALEHHLLLIHDSVEVKSVKTTKGSDVERRLDDINASISELDEKTDLQFKAVKEVKLVAEDMAKMIGIDWDDDAMLGAEEHVPTPPETVDSIESTAGEHAGFVVGLEDAKMGAERGDQPRPAVDGETSQLSLRDRLTALEENVRNVNQTLRGIAQDNQPSALGNKLDALEAKMDRQFGAMLALMQNFIAGPERVNATPNDSVV